MVNRYSSEAQESYHKVCVDVIVVGAIDVVIVVVVVIAVVIDF